MDKESFFIALKLLTIVQQGISLRNYISECNKGIFLLKKIEQPLPKFNSKEIKEYGKQNEKDKIVTRVIKLFFLVLVH